MKTEALIYVLADDAVPVRRLLPPERRALLWLILTMVYLIGNVYGFDLVKGTGDEFSWFGVKSISAGIFGIPAAFIVTYVVSRMTPAPSREMQDFVLRLRVPKGGQLMVQTH